MFRGEIGGKELNSKKQNLGSKLQQQEVHQGESNRRTKLFANIINFYFIIIMRLITRQYVIE